MAPTTRTKAAVKALHSRAGLEDAKTPKKTEFFTIWDSRPEGESRNAFCDRTGYKRTNTKRWLDQRQLLGSPAYRRTRKLAERLGRKPRMSDEAVRDLLDPKKNKYKRDRYEVMVANIPLPIQPRQLRRRLVQCTHNARRYKQAIIKDDLTSATRIVR